MCNMQKPEVLTYDTIFKMPESDEYNVNATAMRTLSKFGQYIHDFLF